jgi:ssDNA-binding Zn-finger/Zn-ribbon topoisomerase 1
MIDKLEQYTSENKLKWIAIFDQHHVLFPDNLELFPFTLIDYLRDCNVIILISATENNKGYPLEFVGLKTHAASWQGFDDHDFRVWCQTYPIGEGLEVDRSSIEAMEVRFCTGSLPLELSLVCPQCGDTLEEKLRVYRRERFGEFIESHIRFERGLDKAGRSNLQECVLRLIHRLEPPHDLHGMDRELFVIVQHDDGTCSITAITPLAREALLEYHKKALSLS